MLAGYVLFLLWDRDLNIFYNFPLSLFLTLWSDISWSFASCLGLKAYFIPFSQNFYSNPLFFPKSAFPVSNFTINNKFSFLNNNFNSTGNFPSEKLFFFFFFAWCCCCFLCFSHTHTKKKLFNERTTQKKINNRTLIEWKRYIVCSD